jgi:hypothetical protein
MFLGLRVTPRLLKLLQHGLVSRKVWMLGPFV